MMDLDTLRYMNKRATYKAARDRRLPLIFDESDVRTEVFGNLPYFGEYVPTGWTRVNISDEFGLSHEDRGDFNNVNVYFVDSTGAGRDYELALTQAKFAALLRPGYGYAILEAGPQQDCVGVFKRKRARRGLTPEQILMIQRSTY